MIYARKRRKKKKRGYIEYPGTGDPVSPSDRRFDRIESRYAGDATSYIPSAEKNRHLKLNNLKSIKAELKG